MTADPLHRVLLGDCLHMRARAGVPDGSCAAAIYDPPGELGFMGLSWDRRGGEAFRDWLAERVAACMPLVARGGWHAAWGHPKTSDWTVQAMRRAGLTIEGKVVRLTAEGRPSGGYLAPGHEEWILGWAGPGPRAPLYLDEWRPIDGRDPRTAWVGSGYARALDAIVGPRPSGAYSGKRAADRAGKRSTYGGFGGTEAGRGREASTGGISRFFPGVREADEVPALLLVGPKARHAHRDAGGGERTAHPTAKSPREICPLVALLTRPGDAVLDVTAGEGGVLHAAAALGRRAVGCEISRAHAELLHRRLDRLGGCLLLEGPGALP